MKPKVDVSGILATLEEIKTMKMSWNWSGDRMKHRKGFFPSKERAKHAT